LNTDHEIYIKTHGEIHVFRSESASKFYILVFTMCGRPVSTQASWPIGKLTN